MAENQRSLLNPFWLLPKIHHNITPSFHLILLSHLHKANTLVCLFTNTLFQIFPWYMMIYCPARLYGASQIYLLQQLHITGKIANLLNLNIIHSPFSRISITLLRSFSIPSCKPFSYPRLNIPACVVAVS